MVYPEHMTTLGWVVSTAIMVMLVALIVALVVWAVQGRHLPVAEQPPEPSPRTPHEAVAHRYAAGEIDEHEYRRVRDVLAETPQPRAAPESDEPAGPGAG
jgi:uncharacterized membrane protein